MTAGYSGVGEKPSAIHKVLNHISIRVKLAALAAISALAMISLAGWMTWHDYATACEARRVGLRQNIESMNAVLVWAHAQEQAGTWSREQAQAAALNVIRTARYGTDEYFWVNDMTPRMLMHPIKPDLDGKDLSAIKDPQGTAVFVKFVETVQAHDAGYVTYFWPKPGQQEPVEKVSFVVGFKPWGWVLGSGLYMDDLRAAFYEHTRSAAGWVFAALALTLVAVRLVYASITRGLDKATRVARAISQGDVSNEIILIGSDEIGDLIGEMKSMSDGLNQTIGEVHAAANSLAMASLAMASQEIASANQDLSGRTEKTASNLAQAASNLSQVTQSVQGNTQAAERVRMTAASASDVACQGGEIVGRAVATMTDINESSRKIADIIGVIDSIAFQTNILALNAAVEAARAGEQGRGFAVVATEVRMLAQRSAGAAREIKSLIQESVDHTGEGAKMVESAGQAMQRIVSTVKEVHALIEGISHASLEQGCGVGQVNRAVSELDDMTQQNAALVEQSAAAAQSLHEQAQRLSAAVGRFKLDTGHVIRFEAA